MTPEDILAQPANILSQADREFFFDHGYLFPERIIPPDWLERLCAASVALAERSLDESRRTADFEYEEDPAGGPPRLRQIINAVDYHPEFWAYASSLFLTDLVADLVGPDVKFRESAMSYKPPMGAGGFKWHQDLAFYPSSNRSLIMMLHLLDDVTADQGPTRIIPGSHKDELYDHYDEQGTWLGVMGDHDVKRQRIEDAIPITGPPGSILITDTNIVHAAGRNESGRGRPMALTGYQSADTFSLTEIPYLSTHRWEIVRGRPASHAHTEALVMKMPPDWPRYAETRMDNALYAREQGVAAE